MILAMSAALQTQPTWGRVMNTIHSTEYVDHYLGGTLLIRDPIPFLTGNTVLGSISVYARRALLDEWLAAARLRLSRRQ